MEGPGLESRPGVVAEPSAPGWLIPTCSRLWSGLCGAYSLRQRHMTGPLTGNMPPEADFHNRRPGASVVETDGRDGGTNKDTRALLNRGSVDLPGKPARNGPGQTHPMMGSVASAGAS